VSEQRDLEAAVLRLVLDVGSFTIPQLVSLTGIGHEIVARTLEAALGDGIKRTDEVTAGGLAAPARIWVVDDPGALEARLSDRGRPAARTAAFAPRPEAERELAAAEDAVVIALQARRPEHAAEFADQAAAALRRSGIAPTGDERLPLGAKRNLKPVDARACSVAALSTYLRSREAEGLSGPLWRQAFSTVAAVDLPEEGAFQKRLLADLVRVADERAVARFAEAAAGDGEQLVRTAHEAYGLSTEVPEALVDGLARLATGEDRLLAERARQALIAIAQPRDESFWRALAGTAHPAPQQVVFRGLSRFDLKAAFAYLLEQITTDEAGIAAAVTTLQACLPALAEEAPVLAEDLFAALLASLTADDRGVLMAAPVLAGLSWAPSAFERPLGRRLLAAISRWGALLGGGHSDARVRREIKALGREIRSLGPQTFPHLGAVERRYAVELLLDWIADEAGADVAVPVLVGIGRAADVARAVAECHPSGEGAARWYLQACPTNRLEAQQRDALLGELNAALQPHAGFLDALENHATESHRELPELTENVRIDHRRRARVQMALDGAAFPEPRNELDRIAASAGV